MTIKTLAPIVLFVYNRPWHTLQTLEALANNTLAKESVLYIYADGAREGADEEILKNIEKTRSIIEQRQWCKEVHIIESEKNKGLADSIIHGVTEIVNRYGKIIVLEDDIVTSTGFLQYMNDALDLYEKDEKVMHISSFVPVTTGINKLPNIYFLRFMSCWGWGTWKKAWNSLIVDTEYLYKTLPTEKDFQAFNLEGAINQFSQIEDNLNKKMKTWAIKWYATIFLKKGLCLYPKYSLVRNIGLDGSGENCITAEDDYNVDLSLKIQVYSIPIQEDKYAKEYLRRFYLYGRNSSLNKRIIYRMRQSRIFHYMKSTYLYKLYTRIRYK